MATVSKHSHRTLSIASNLANLLPTGTVLIFQALLPPFSNNGNCWLAQKYLSLGLIFIFSLACFLSSSLKASFMITGSSTSIATWSGLYGFNNDLHDRLDLSNDETTRKKLKAQSLNLIDFVHAIGSLVVFLVVSISSYDVQHCFIPKAGTNKEALITNLPLGAGLLASILFMIFPTKRRGIWYGDMVIGSGTTAQEEKQPKGA